MEQILEAIGPLGILIAGVLVLVFGNGIITKFKNNSALKENDEGNKEIVKREHDIMEHEILLAHEAKRRLKLKAELEGEKGREITDKELNDFFDKRYPKH